MIIKKVKHAISRPRETSSVDRCLAQLFTGAGGFNAATGLLRGRTVVEIVDVRHWSLGHVAFTAETARNARVEYVAAIINAGVHAHGGI